jgi:hypothetical protein
MYINKIKKHVGYSLIYWHPFDQIFYVVLPHNPFLDLPMI